MITADDFGLSEQVNAAVEAAHRNGILSAASLMVGGAAAADAVERARRLPDLRVGLHLVLADGDPLSKPSEIPGLIDRAGRLRGDLARYGVEIALWPSLRRQVAAEITAQFDAFKATGLALDHVNGHCHFHLTPSIAGAVIAIGRNYGMKALRVPRELRRLLVTIDPRTPRDLDLITAPWAAWLRRRALRAGLTTSDRVFGLAWTGAMTRQRVAALLARLPAGFTEIYLHPATSNAFPGAAPNYRYTEELAALCDPQCAQALRLSGCTLGGYADAMTSMGSRSLCRVSLTSW